MATGWSCLEVAGSESLSFLTLPEAKALLSFAPTEKAEPFILSLQLDRRIVGLAVFVKYPLERTAQLYSLTIQEAFRSRGGGFHLLQEAVHRLQAQGIEWIECEYRAEGPCVVAFEKLLEKTGWEKPSLYLQRCRFRSANFSPPWLPHLQRPVPDLDVFFWHERSQEDEWSARWLLEQGHVPAFLSPFDQVSNQEPINSLGARLDGRVVGWMITHRPDEETIRYSSLFFDRHSACSRYGLFLLGEAIRLQQASTVPFGLCEVNLEKVEPAWIRFVEKRLAPYAESVEQRKWVCKSSHAVHSDLEAPHSRSNTKGRIPPA